MYTRKLVLGTGNFGLPAVEQPSAIKRAGFDGFFSGYDGRESVEELAKIAEKEGLIYQSVHAPFHNIGKIWHEGEAGDAATIELVECIEASAAVGVKKIVSHVYIGFDLDEHPTEIGLCRLAKAVSAAEKCGVRLAFENTEGEEFLAVVMNEFRSKSVGFCFDSGHEQCYNLGKDMLALYGDRLFCTHLNDNLGVSDFGGHIIWTDDLHLLPFDGIIDWANLANRLASVGYNEELTFELNKASKSNRHDNDKYAQMPTEIYLAEAYARACRVAALCGRAR